MGMIEGLSVPQPLGDRHLLDAFDCGEAVTNARLKDRAFASNRDSASRVYVIASGREVKGYYSLAVGSVDRALAPGRIRRNMPDPIPVLLLARLAGDKSLQGRGLGHALLRDAILRTIQAADIIGIRAILVHALSSRARKFYLNFGFLPNGINDLAVMLPLQIARASLAARTASGIQ